MQDDKLHEFIYYVITFFFNNFHLLRWNGNKSFIQFSSVQRSCMFCIDPFTCTLPLIHVFESIGTGGSHFVYN